MHVARLNEMLPRSPRGVPWARRSRVGLADVPVESLADHALFELADPWTRKLFLALRRRYGLTPFRRYR